MSRMRDIELKAGRALVHLNALKGALQDFYDAQPLTLTTRRCPEIGRRILRIEMNMPNETIYLLAGDFVHNLRSSLDHVIYALIVHSTTQLPDSSQIQWPAQSKQKPKNFERQIEGVPGNAAKIIESLQPYNQGPGDAFKKSLLWQLHKLDIVDKHRRLTMDQLITQPYFPTLRKQSDFVAEIVGDGLEVSFPIDAPEVPVHYSPNPEVRFGAAEEGLSVNVEGLEKIFKFVTIDVLPQFSPFLT